MATTKAVFFDGTDLKSKGGGEAALASVARIGGAFKIGAVANNSEIEADGTLKFNGDATVYDDLQVTISNIKLPPSQTPRDGLWNFGIGGGIEFPVLAFDLNEYVYFDLQTSHSMTLNTVLENHIHYSLPNTTDIGDAFRFRLDVVAAGVDHTWAVPTGSPYFKETLVAADDNTKHRLSSTADIAAVNTTLSTIYKCRLTRVSVVAPADEYGSEVYVTFIDSHYEKDTVGSREMITK